jgi:type I restriction enzyme, S subunit
MARGAKRAAVDVGPVEGPWDLPDGWRWERLGDLGKWFGGGTPSKQQPEFWTEGDIPWVSPKDMKRFELDDTQDHITSAGIAGSAAKLVPAQSVVCVMRSGILKHSFPVAIINRPMTLNQDMRAVRPDDCLQPRYLAYFLKSAAQSILHECSKDGTTVDSIEASRLMETPVPLPGENVQRQIVARIDALFAEIDEGEAALAAARSGVETYRKALLKAAVTGELTADWRAANPPQESGEQLLQRILTDRRTRWHADPKNARKTSVEPSGPDTDGLPELPDGWVWASVGQLGDVVTGGTPPASDKSAFDGLTPFFTPTDLNAGYGLNSSTRTISESALARLRPIPANSVLVTCIGATIGKTGLTQVAGATNQQINAICGCSPEVADFLFAYFYGPVGRGLVVSNASATTLPILNKGDFSQLAVPLPPFAELIEINRILAKSRADEPERTEMIEEANEAASTLRQSILAAAFRGELSA